MLLTIILVSATLDLVKAGIPSSSYHFQNSKCFSETCQHSARFVRQSINPNISPCEDFYEYACGGWLRAHQIPQTKPMYSVSIEANDLMYDQIRSLLEANQTRQHPSRSVQLAKFIYDQCLSIGNLDHDGQIKIEKLTKLLFRIGIQKKSKKWYEIYLLVPNPSTLITTGLFRMEVIANPENTTENILSLDSVEFPLSDNELRFKDKQRSKVLLAYRVFLQSVFKLIPDFRYSNSTIIDNLIEKILIIESRLSHFKMSSKDRRHSSKVINILTFEEFHNITAFNWLQNIFNPTLELFNVSLKVPQKPSDRLLVTDLGYFINLIEYIPKVPIDLLKTYFDLQIARELTPYLGEKYRHDLYRFLKVKSGVKVIPQRWRTCYSQIQKLLPWALSRLYVDHHFEWEDQLQAQEIIDNIHQAFVQIINDTFSSSDLIDQQIRKLSLQKLDHIRKNVAYPKWLLDNQELDKFHNWNLEILNRTLDDYFPMLNQFKWNQMQANFENLQPKSLSENVSDDKKYSSWLMEPATINAAYSPEDNTIIIPAGILKPPFFHRELPLSMNYGAIGSVVGHELTHSLDDDGRHYDHEGNYHRYQKQNELEQQGWWSKDMLKNFYQRSECLMEQYSSIQDPITKLQLDGNNTLSENIADNGGIHEAFYAFQLEQYRNPTRANQILADLPEFTPEQLFFLSNAQIWCTKLRPEALRAKIHNDPHVPAKYRVNIPASNSYAFARAFGCPEGSKMNPQSKCVLW